MSWNTINMFCNDSHQRVQSGFTYHITGLFLLSNNRWWILQSLLKFYRLPHAEVSTFKSLYKHPSLSFVCVCVCRCLKLTMQPSSQQVFHQKHVLLQKFKLYEDGNIKSQVISRSKALEMYSLIVKESIFVHLVIWMMTQFSTCWRKLWMGNGHLLKWEEKCYKIF